MGGVIQACLAMNCLPKVHKDKAGTLPIVLYQNEKQADVNTAERRRMEEEEEEKEVVTLSRSSRIIKAIVRLD